MSVRENMAFALKLRKLPKNEIDQRVREAADVLGLTNELDRLPKQLSGGQRQRAWIAMALAQETGILLLDEPTTFLDLSHQLEVMDLLTELNERDQRTIVLVLHDLNQACRYAHHLIAMKGGRIVAEGAPSEILTSDLVLDVFGVRCRVESDPVSHTPMVIPIGRRGVVAVS
jgi:iron complex transport system ATP-binding protein